MKGLTEVFCNVADAMDFSVAYPFKCPFCTRYIPSLSLKIHSDNPGQSTHPGDLELAYILLLHLEDIPVITPGVFYRLKL